jgi:hypothetical protein
VGAEIKKGAGKMATSAEMERWLEKVRKAVDDYIGSGGKVSVVLQVVEDSCAETAEHIRANWQDQSNSKLWDRKSAIIDKAVCAMLKMEKENY